MQNKNAKKFILSTPAAKNKKKNAKKFHHSMPSHGYGQKISRKRFETSSGLLGFTALLSQ
jgi:hypothetical protein